ncbi:hypothetical protein AAX05_08775 [Moraxella bovoculi]|uniref:Uncharacterized protein n=1 Tax=Moraxella bovoculi TaxID=386891 RepID=A0AAC8T7M7_9GAMM|nr:hypothetical protein [Moraxella bovoculi]AKG07172.1 hypothetical protein AAX06_02180 [Moraxella bovoculi]AKG10221.1 hypothetical protein AAX05_08775 [Moraxella bovoculi]AKG12143.1 hypothetical protein AAX07_09320 [Moraxella bovoculi]AKG14112.1 hypothetical protein AAX11_08865 [Moraxella bovoculi]
MHHTIARMNAFNKAFGNAKDCYKKMQAWHLNNKPKHIFSPLQNTLSLNEGLAALYELHGGKEDEHILSILCCLYLYGTWRNTLGIYQLDEEIIKDCKELPDDTPTSIFLNLPDWCVYVDISSAKIATIDGGVAKHIKGFWAIYDNIEMHGVNHDVLNFIIDTDTDNNIYVPQSLILSSEMSVAESLDYGLTLFGYDESNELVKGMLPYLLWLCVAEPDITHKGLPVSREELTKPKHGINKKTGAFVTPSEPFIYQIGERLGGEVRRYQSLIDDEKNQNRHHTKRPHIRRGHWHGYWQGTGQAKEFKVRWQPAVFVNSGV